MKNKFVIATEGLSDIWSLRKRGQRDADRHRQRVKDAAKQNLKDIIAQEDIISTDSNGKKIKIPMRYLKQWRFKHGDNKKDHGVGHGGKDLKPGDVIHKEKDEEGQGNKAGDKSGDMVYEEFALDEVIDMMMEDLNLPFLQDKTEKVEIETETIVYEDISRKGLLPNLDMRRTIKENLKRNAALGKGNFVGGFKKDDLRFKTYEIKKEYKSNAAIYLVMDRSGSMTTDKKYIAKSFFFWMVQFIKRKYTNIDIVFIAHDTEAYICDEKNFFGISESGGTKCSSGFEAALTHIKHYHPVESWNNYVFAISDGDNYGDDNKKCVELVKELLTLSSAVGYGEIILTDMYSFMGNIASGNYSTLHTEFKQSISANNFVSVSMNKKDDVYKCLKQFFGLNTTEATK